MKNSINNKKNTFIRRIDKMSFFFWQVASQKLDVSCMLTGKAKLFKLIDLIYISKVKYKLRIF